MNFFKPKFWDKNQISFFAILLFPIALIINVFTLFKRTLAKYQKCMIPAICVGNIYLGGTGKTPLCIEIFSILKDLNMKPAFVRKKYNSFQDETNLLKQTAPVYESNKRVDALNNAIKDIAEIAVLDDGFQDFSIKKDLSIICFNEKQWIGNGFVVPAGPLRESVSALKRADFVIKNGKKNAVIEKKILEKKNSIKIFYIQYKALNIEKFKNNRILAFAGIGNPDNFFKLLNDNNIKIFEEKSFPDHYKYSDKELESLINKAEKNNVTLLTTEKDFFRIDEKKRKKINYLKIAVKLENKDHFINEIKKII